jgi:drug/metabolite transporter (DMT)-like permease
LPSTHKPIRIVAIIESVLTALIWSSSFVIVKMGLGTMGPLTIAGLRYSLAGLVLLPILLFRWKNLRTIPGKVWIKLLLIGMCAYFIGNGAMFWALESLPATTVSLLMNFQPLFILFLGAVWLKEKPSFWQIVGVVLSLVGSVLFFLPIWQSSSSAGIIIAVASLLGFTLFTVIGRQLARDQLVDTLTLTAIPLLLGGIFTMGTALIVEGVPVMTLSSWEIAAWLAIVNTAIGYMLYNSSLQTVTAMEMSVVLNLSPLGTAFFAWLLLGEKLFPIQVIATLVVITGVTIVQIMHRNSKH